MSRRARAEGWCGRWQVMTYQTVTRDGWRVTVWGNNVRFSSLSQARRYARKQPRKGWRRVVRRWSR